MKLKFLYCLLIITFLGNSIFITGCEGIKNSDSTRKQTLKDIAFDVNEKFGYTVYIKENSLYVPYLVLTADYNGKALLLRQELLGEPRAFNDDSYGYSGFYKGSSIDIFLNNVYLSTLELKIQNAIVDSEITITSKSSLDITGTDTEAIVRKVFLLSYTEVGLSGNAVANIEGKPLKYFNHSNNLVANTDIGASSWWLRTSDTWGSNMAWGIGPKGTSGSGSVDAKNGIRPAFCLDNNLTIEKSEEIIEGQKVYLIAF